MILEDSRNILSVQSHVVHGYVGNRVATFPLQCQGWNVDSLNTVNFSNHTGYGSVKGTKITPDEIKALYDGLQQIGFTYDAFLTGYIPGADALKVVGEIGLDVKKKNPNAVWLLDPVMGDEGRLYVSHDVIPTYQELLLKGGIDIITPNQFETELLVGFAINSLETLKKALSDLHVKYKVHNVVISSMKLQADGFDSQKLLTVSSRYLDGEVFTNVFEVPYIESYFTGVGDLFSALLIDRVHTYCKEKNGEAKDFLNDAVNEVLSVMSIVLQVTNESAKRALGPEMQCKMGSAVTMKECELRLIECRKVYGNKEKKFVSKAI